jgi:hypothetical protein
MIAGMMAPEKSWCLVECLARWEPQEEGVINTAARFSLSSETKVYRSWRGETND